MAPISAISSTSGKIAPDTAETTLAVVAIGCVLVEPGVAVSVWIPVDGDGLLAGARRSRGRLAAGAG